MKKIMSYKEIRAIYILLLIFSFSGCTLSPSASRSQVRDSFASLDYKANKSSQVLLAVCNRSWFFNDTTIIYALEKQDGKWNLKLEPIPAVIGKNGFAKLGEKREGDGRTPSGIFPLEMAFGYEATIKTLMPYRQSQLDDLWVDDVNAADYNQWVKKENTLAKSYEKMKRDDNLYKYGIVIEYNTAPVIKGNGSAIFFHVWGGEDITTEGCIAVSENDIIKILEWLNPAAKPIIIMGNTEFIEELLK
jgi:L,D-peptidoglycan transpeptidase YkuD (ErfK/YbiS/YcfS/YnhG family)